MFWKLIVTSVACSFFITTAAVAQTPEIHVIGVYEGDIRTEGKVHGPEARVFMDRPNESVNLVVGSYNPVRWIVNVSAQTQINNVFFYGRGADRSEILVDDVKRQADILNIDAVYQDQGRRFRSLVDGLSLHFEVEGVSSFHGAYTAPDDPFVIDDIEKAANNRFDYLRSAVDKDALTGRLQNYLDNEEDQALRLDQDGFHMRVDGEMVHYPVTLDVPEISSAGIAAHDPDGQRLFGVPSRGGKFVYSYDIQNDVWSAFETDRHSELRGMVYDKARDRVIVGVTNFAGHPSNTSRLSELTPSGISKRIRHEALIGLNDVAEIGNGPPPSVAALAIDGDLLLARGQSFTGQHRGQEATRLYVIDLSTGEVTLVGIDR